MKYLLFISFLAINISLIAMPQDSVGIKVIDGKTYIMHKVEKGDGVYAIGRQYGVSASDIFAANEGSDKSIMIDQILLVPKTFSTNPTSTSSTTTKSEKTYHTVSKGETLSAIARKYNTTVEEIKSLNNLKGDNINLNQKLVVGEKNTTVVVKKQVETPAPAPKKADIPTVAPVTKPNIVNEVPASTSNNAVVQPKETPKTEKSNAVVNTYSTDDGDEISEKGLAMISNEGELTQERSFIFHPTAKIGTIVMITNPVNGNTVFARVIGNCKPESGVVLKMSKTVAMKLGVSENTEVKLSYAK